MDRSRYPGICYGAANWISVGLTQGRGRMDRSGQAQDERKEIVLYPYKTGPAASVMFAAGCGEQRSG